MSTNAQIIKTITTTDLARGGLLNPEQAEKFIQQTFEATTIGGLLRSVRKKSRKGEVDKIGIASRILRGKTEGTDDGYRAKTKHSKIEYSTNSIRLPWEITGETLRENIEKGNFENIVTNLMTTQLGIDRIDLLFNSDTETSSDDPDYEFLKLDDGFIKQIKNGGHVVDVSSESAMKLDFFYDAVQSMPNKYNNGKLRWLMSPHRAQQWTKTLLNQVIEKGGAVPESVYKSPVSIPAVEVPQLSDDVIILADPKNLCVVDTYDVIIKKTSEGEKAIMQDKIFYVCHFDMDAVIEELDATAIITGLKF